MVGKTRRTILTGAGALAASTLAAPFVQTARAQNSKELVFVGFGGTYQDGQTKAYIEPFQQETGIKVIQTSGVDIAKLRAQVQAKRVEWDIITFPDRLRTTAMKENLFQPLDFGVIDASQIMPGVVTKISVGHIMFAMQLTYSFTFYKDGGAPKNWKDYWDLSRVKGVRGMYNTPPYTLEIALLADGVPKDKLYPIDVERAFKSLDKIKDKIVWWDQFPQPGVMLESGTITMTPWTRGPSLALFDKKPIDVSFEDYIATYEAWMVPTGAPHADAAMKFVNFVIKAERQAALTKYVAAGPTNLKAAPLVAPEVARWLPTTHENVNKGLLLDGSYWAENLNRITERWNEWRLAR